MSSNTNNSSNNTNTIGSSNMSANRSHRRTLSAADGTAAQRYLLDNLSVFEATFGPRSVPSPSSNPTANVSANSSPSHNVGGIQESVSFENGQWNELSSRKDPESISTFGNDMNYSHRRLPPRSGSNSSIRSLNTNVKLAGANDVLNAAAEMIQDDLDGLCFTGSSGTSNTSPLMMKKGVGSPMSPHSISSMPHKAGMIDKFSPTSRHGNISDKTIANIEVKLDKLEKSLGDLTQNLNDWRGHFDKSFAKVMSVVQAETSRRVAIENRLHSQLLLQSENMIAMELKLLRLEAKAAASGPQGSLRGTSRSSAHTTNSLISNSRNISNAHVNNSVAIEDGCESLGSSTATPSMFSSRPIRTAIMSSTASLASGVTADEVLQEGDTSHRDDDHTDEDDGADADDESEGGDVAEVDDFSTGSIVRNRMTLDTMLQNDAESAVNKADTHDSSLSVTGLSTRAIRGPPSLDGASSLGTNLSSATGLTAPETVLSNATASVVNPRSLPDDDATMRSNGTTHSRNRDALSRSANLDSILGLEPPPPRSRSQSPMTVPSVATSIGTSIAAVAPSRAHSNRRQVTAVHTSSEAHEHENESELGGKSERAVSFVDTAAVSFGEGFSANDSAYGGDSLTMPDEIDTFSDAAGVVESFASSSSAWREEYEARLDAIQKRFSDDT